MGSPPPRPSSSSSVVSCCLPPPTASNSPGPMRVARRDFVLRSSELATLAAIFHLRNYNPKYGGRGKPISKDEAIKELIQVVTETKPDSLTPRIVEKTDDYVRVEYESPIFGFVDDAEFWFPPGKKSIVQYRSASRSGFIDFNANKKRVKALRLALEKKGWASESGI